MAYTIVAFIWRKPGLSPTEFKSHYETSHIPLLLSLTGPLFPLSHSRFYLGRNASDTSSSDTTNANHQPTVFAGTPNDFDYDVLATLIFEDTIAFEAFHARLREPEVASKLAEDEERFMDRQKLKVAAVDQPLVSTRPSG